MLVSDSRPAPVTVKNPLSERRGRAARKACVMAALRKGFGRPSPAVFEIHHLLTNSPVDLGRIALLTEADEPLTRAIWQNCARICGTNGWDGDSLDEAIVLLGVDRFRFVTAAQHLLGCRAPAAGPDLKRWFWERSFHVACVSDRIGRWLGVYPTEFPFLAGLFHDVGVLPLMAALRAPDRCVGGYRSVLCCVEKERGYFGLDHCAAGGLMAGAWELPSPIGEVIIHHHDDPLPPVSPRLVRIVAAAEEVVSTLHAQPQQASHPSPCWSQILATRLPELGDAGTRNLAACLREEWRDYSVSRMLQGHNPAA